MFEYVAPAPVLEYIAPEPAVSFVAPSQQLRPAFTADTTGVNLDAAVEGSASQVVGSLPHGEVFAVPVFNQVHQEQLTGGEIPENLVEIPVVQELFPAGEATEKFATIPVVHEQVILGLRPDPLAEPRHWFIPGLEALCPDDDGAQSLSLPSLADRAAEEVDSSSLRFLTASALEARRREEEEEKEKKRKVVVEVLARAQERVRNGLPLSSAEDAASRQWSGLPPKQEKRRKRKKRRKRRTPRSPRPLLGARARRRQRQWHDPGFPCDVSPRAVFPSGVVRLKMLRIMAGMDQKDYCSGMDNAGFAGDPTLRAVSSFLRGCLRILRNAWFALDTCSLVRCTQSRAGSTAGRACSQLQLRSPP